MTIPQAFTLAFQHHQASRLTEAETIYRQILAVQPAHPESLHLLGVIARQRGLNDMALELIGRAITIFPGNPTFHYNLGIVLFDLGRHDAAIAAYRRAIQLQPDYVEAYVNLGSVLKENGQLEEAVAVCRRVLQFKPDHANGCNNLANALSDLGQFDEAITIYQRALELQPDLATVYNNLGIALRRAGRTAEAVAACTRASQLDPALADAHHNLGNVLLKSGRAGEAIAAYQRAIDLRPDFAEAHNNLGNAFRDECRPAEAIASYRRAIECHPRYAEAHTNLGCILDDSNRLDEALACYERALALDPSSVAAHNNLGNAFKNAGRLDEAIACYRRAVALGPDCAPVHSNLIYTLHFHPAHDAASLTAEHAQWNRMFADPLRKLRRPHQNSRDPNRRLRVGYVSPDFSRHVISRFLVPLLEAHDHESFEIHCYASVPRPDRITRRLRHSADVWKDVRTVRDDALAEMIRADRIDILVDLTQHMVGNRLPLFARKPAPVQVAWLGYPGSTGLDAMDYRITDAWIEPERAPWSEPGEKIVRLPDSWFCFDPLDEFPPPGDLPALHTGQVTFGCLNNFCKVSEMVFDRWAGVLRAVPGSRLLLRCPDGHTQSRVREFLRMRGGEPERVEFVGWVASHAEFLREFDRIDLALDPFPYNGGTTTCEALWMGVPVLTLPGRQIVSRLGLSILSAAGMPEFIADSEAGYVDLAADLANDLPRLARFRATLRERMRTSPFMDARRFAKNVEAAYRTMWQTWCGAGVPN